VFENPQVANYRQSCVWKRSVFQFTAIVYLKTMIFQMIDSRVFENPLFSNCSTDVSLQSLPVLKSSTFVYLKTLQVLSFSTIVCLKTLRFQIIDSRVFENGLFFKFSRF
jgi:hypothetical protein